VKTFGTRIVVNAIAYLMVHKRLVKDELLGC